jgi:hypothetical protein
MERNAPVPPRILGGRWELLSPLASGGMGVLYVGRHVQTGRRAAVKLIDHATPEAIARFKLEASISAQLNHPGIVDVYDADSDAVRGSCFIAMELLEGRTLRMVMDDPAATPRQVLDLLIGALEPLVAAHAAGFVHRDLKPENIFVCDGEPTRVKLLDFGIVSQPADQRLTRVGVAMGTPHYMSPEQATSAREAGPASDVWSMGVMMYEAIRGEVPFVGETSNAVVIGACTCPHAPLDTITAGVDPEVARLVDRCLAKDPLARPADARTLLSELRGMLRPNSLPASRPSVRPRPELSTATSEVRPSLRTRNITKAAQVLAASGVVAGLSALALPFTGVAAPGAALLFAAIGGGLLYSAGNRLRTLKALAAAPANQNHKHLAFTIHEDKPVPVPEHPMRGSERAVVKIEMFADLSCAITRRVCLRVLALRAEHPDEIVVVYRPLWSSEREHSRLIAETARAIFERDGAEVFWEFFDRLVSTTRKITPMLVVQAATDAGAEMHGLGRALRSNIHRRSLYACRDEAELLGVTDTPAVRVNGNMLPGELTEDRLHWAYVDSKSAAERRRVDELGATRASRAARPLSRCAQRSGLTAAHARASLRARLQARDSSAAARLGLRRHRAALRRQPPRAE